MPQLQNVVSTTLAGQVMARYIRTATRLPGSARQSSCQLLKDILARIPIRFTRACSRCCYGWLHPLRRRPRSALDRSRLHQPLRHRRFSSERLRADAAAYPDTMDQRFEPGATPHALRLIYDGGSHGPKFDLPAAAAISSIPAAMLFLEGTQSAKIRLPFPASRRSTPSST